jgi:aminoglycoside phosphotransferase (APT) family kinase protein
MARVDGKPMLENRHISGDALGHIEALATLLAQLHRLAPLPSIRDVLPRVTLEREFVQLAQTARQCQDSKLLETVLALRAAEMEELPPCVLHSDLRFDNVLYDARGITAVLGWENAALGDPRWDVGRIVHELRSHRADELIEPFCAAYAEQNDIPWSNVAYWEALTATQSWALIEWLHDNAPQDAQELLSEREDWRGRTWRAFARFRHTQESN